MVAGVGDADAVAELRLDAEAMQHGVDLRAAAVHEHEAQADAGEEHQVADHRRLQLRGLHRRAAVLDHHRLALEPLDEGERLRQDAHAVQRRGRGLGRQVGGGRHAEATGPRRGEEGRGAASIEVRVWEGYGREGEGKAGLVTSIVADCGGRLGH
jgi:hypothetical protein